MTEHGTLTIPIQPLVKTLYSIDWSSVAKFGQSDMYIVIKKLLHNLLDN